MFCIVLMLYKRYISNLLQAFESESKVQSYVKIFRDNNLS